MKHRCEAVRSVIGDYAEPGALSTEERAMFDDHLAECTDCLAQMKGMVVQRAVLPRVVGDGEEAPLSETLVTRCVAAMKRAAGESASDANARTA